MHRPLLAVLALALAACGGGAGLQTVHIVNATSRTIEELYVYPTGSPQHGTSRGTLAPNASTDLKIKSGHIEVLAVSEKVQIDEHTRDKPSASTAVELKGPVELVFYDASAKPPGVERKGTIGVEFTLLAPTPAPTPDGDAPPAP